MISLIHALLVLLLAPCFSHDYMPLRELSFRSPRVVSTACRKIRSKPYRGRLDLLFIYVIQHKLEDEFNLPAINAAISSHLISVLDDCDENGEPKFATEIDPNSHTLLTKQDGFCEYPKSGEVKCAEIRGRASVYLDDNAAATEERSVSVIQSLLDDTYLLEQLSGLFFVNSFFVRSLGENLVLFGDEDSENKEHMETDSSDILIAAAVISFVVTVICIYGMYRGRQPASRFGFLSVKHAVAHLYNRRQFFENLEDDEEHEPSWMVTSPESAIYERCPPPSITWSVSDLTSDSRSIRSIIQLGRIVEENNSEESRTSGRNHEPPSQIYRHFDPAELDFVPQWNDASFSVHSSFKAIDSTDSFDGSIVNRFGSNSSEEYGVFPLRGCQFVPEASFDESSCSSNHSKRSRRTISLDCCMSPDSTSINEGEDRCEELVDPGVHVSEDTDIEKPAILFSSAFPVLDLTLLLWWAKFCIDVNRGRSEPRLKN